MQIPFLDLKIQYKSIKSEIDPAIQTILDNTAFVLGKAVLDFETEFAKEHSVKHCLGVSSGTDGNHLALWALDIKQDDEIIIPANTFIVLDDRDQVVKMWRERGFRCLQVANGNF